MLCLTFSNAVLTIEQYAFFDTNALTDVYYYGEEEDWEEISIEDDNYFLNEATVHYLGAPVSDYTVGDVNGDGEVNSLDAIKILRYDAGLITSFE